MTDLAVGLCTIAWNEVPRKLMCCNLSRDDSVRILATHRLLESRLFAFASLGVIPHFAHPFIWLVAIGLAPGNDVVSTQLVSNMKQYNIRVSLSESPSSYR